MKRDKTIDILKGMAIVLMVLGHCGVSEDFGRFIYLFHMAVFVIASGYCYNEKYSQGGYRNYIRRRITGLYFPYVIYKVVLTIFHNFLIYINIYTSSELFLEGSIGNSYGIEKIYTMKDVLIEIIKGLFLFGNEPLLGAGWFIRVLFYMSIMWCVIDNLLQKCFHQYVHELRIMISIVFLLGGWGMLVCNILNISNIPNIFTSYSLFTIGLYMRKLRERLQTWDKSAITEIVMGGMGFIILWLLWKNNIKLNMVYFDHPVLAIMASLSGWTFLLSLSKGMMRVSKMCVTIFSFLGENTMSIVLFHFVCFKPITFMQILFYHLPWYRLASFPIFKAHPVWWLLYAASGLILPICIWKYLDGLKTHNSGRFAKS